VAARLAAPGAWRNGDALFRVPLGTCRAPQGISISAVIFSTNLLEISGLLLDGRGNPRSSFRPLSLPILACPFSSLIPNLDDTGAGSRSFSGVVRIQPNGPRR
jgi:hypothetical protein